MRTEKYGLVYVKNKIIDFFFIIVFYYKTIKISRFGICVGEYVDTRSNKLNFCFYCSKQFLKCKVWVYLKGTQGLNTNRAQFVELQKI